MKNLIDILTWSLLDHKPIAKYSKEYDVTFVAWNGFLLTQKLALALTMETYHIWCTPSMQKVIKNEYTTLHSAGAFGDVHWEDIINNRLLGYARRKLLSHRKKVLQDIPVTEAIKWFKVTKTVDE